MPARKIAVIGAGYVGLTTAATLAAAGHGVTCVDVDRDKVAELRAGRVALLEPDLPELVAAGRRAGLLRFTARLPDALLPPHPPDLVFVCVPTPRGEGGAADVSIVEAVARDLGRLLPPGAAVVLKSTVPVGTADRVRGLLRRPDLPVLSHPEFLSEGSAVHDCRHPDRLVIGAGTTPADRAAARRLADLYTDLAAPVLLTGNASAELIKYAANAFLAVKLSYANTLAELCESVGADIGDVCRGLGLDPRIAPAHLRPSPGWGGPCLPKDTHALLDLARTRQIGFPLVRAALETNDRQHHRIADKVRTAAGGCLDGVRIAVYGLAFKAGTADTRDSPALAVARLLHAQGAELTVYDPAAANPAGPDDWYQTADNPYTAAKAATVVAVLTEWPEFARLDWALISQLMHRPHVVDARRILDPEALEACGLTVSAVGRGTR